MYIIAGLGNPGLRYSKTRHNLGFLFLEYICSRLDNFDPFIDKGKFLYKTVNLFEKDTILLKPETYMNLSGTAIFDALSFFNKTWQDLIICYDDFALPAGAIRIRAKGSDGGHNGIGNIIQCIDSKFIRLRFGIGTKEFENINTVDYVLGKITEKELDLYIDAFEMGYDALNYVIAENSIETAMRNYNKKTQEVCLREH